jgi:uncharacterized membrane protein YeaQ/YmgE (transglycosylase-associated protein family)
MEPNTLMDAGQGITSWILIIIVGGLAGWIAEKITKSQMGILMNIIVGIIGSVIGQFLAGLLNIPLGPEIFAGWFFGNLLVAVVGAVILLIAVKMFRGRSA